MQASLPGPFFFLFLICLTFNFDCCLCLNLQTHCMVLNAWHLFTYSAFTFKPKVLFYNKSLVTVVRVAILCSKWYCLLLVVLSMWVKEYTRMWTLMGLYYVIGTFNTGRLYMWLISLSTLLTCQFPRSS